MGKLNKKQEKMIEIAKLVLGYWSRTNDINSPTLDGDMEAEIRPYCDKIPDEFSPLTEGEGFEFFGRMYELLKFLRAMGAEQNLIIEE